MKFWCSAGTRALGKPILELTAADMPLPLLSRQIISWRDELAEGVGFKVIRGVPMEQWSRQEAELFFWCFGLHIGRPGQQNPQGDLLDSYESIATEPGMYLDMDLRPGDIQLLSNHANFHARTQYEDFEDPAQRRHLLRLWLSL